MLGLEMNKKSTVALGLTLFLFFNTFVITRQQTYSANVGKVKVASCCIFDTGYSKPISVFDV